MFNLSTKITNKSTNLNLTISRIVKKSNLGSHKITNFRIQRNILLYFYLDEILALELARKYNFVSFRYSQWYTQRFFKVYYGLDSIKIIK